MPILSPEYISGLYYFVNANNNRIVLLENFAESQIPSIVTPNRLIQGDLGIYVMDMGGKKWETQIASPVFITNNLPAYSNVLELIFTGYNDDNFIVSNINGINTILKSASIDINNKNINCQASLWSDRGSIGNWLAGINAADSINTRPWVGRTASFYDTELILNQWTHNEGVINPFVFAISGHIDIDVDVKEYYFIGTDSSVKNPNPDFLVTGYNIKGSLTCAYPFNFPIEVDSLAPYRQITQGNMFLLSIAGYVFNLSKGNIVIENLKKTVGSSGLTTVDIDFYSYATKSH